MPYRRRLATSAQGAASVAAVPAAGPRRRSRFGGASSARGAAPSPGLSTDAILQAAANMAARLCTHLPSHHLDIGAGHGDLIAVLRQRWPGLDSRACDSVGGLMRLSGMRVDRVNLNGGTLPYADGSFDLVTCTEVLEHVENFRATLREAWRVLKPGGVLVISTPNILNFKSRLRFLVFGFWSLFGPLNAGQRRGHECGGHITPISLYYLLHALKEIGFTEATVDIDKRQRSSLILLVPVYPLLRALFALALRREKRRYKTVDARNEGDVRMINCIDILLGRAEYRCS